MIYRLAKKWIKHKCQTNKKVKILLKKEKTVKQKYLILKDDQNKEMRIKEFAELSKDSESLLFETVCDAQKIEAAIAQGTEELISAFRTKNFFPPELYAQKIADSIVELYQSDQKQSVELICDDLEDLKQDMEEEKLSDEVKSDDIKPDAVDLTEDE